MNSLGHYAEYLRGYAKASVKRNWRDTGAEIVVTVAVDEENLNIALHGFAVRPSVASKTVYGPLLITHLDIAAGQAEELIERYFWPAEVQDYSPHPVVEAVMRIRVGKPYIGAEH